MTPDEIHAVVDRMDAHARQFDRKRGTFREFTREQMLIAKPLLDYRDSGGEHAKLASEGFSFACAGADADGLHLHVEDLTPDHTWADQQTYLERRYAKTSPARALTPVELPAEVRRVADELAEWLERFNHRGKTYREFWDEFTAAAHELDALLARVDLSASVREHAEGVRETPLDMELDPVRLIPPRSLDDLIFDPAAAR
ncbi:MULTISPECIES: hypothetical protein [Luteimonas]|uniref:hypothetical protein n=1 Tax=Luteimonas TaxID=83614 RepID=UPI000C7C3548|nr:MULTISPECIES: hypothetical protein [Luteimonas]